MGVIVKRRFWSVLLVLVLVALASVACGESDNTDNGTQNAGSDAKPRVAATTTIIADIARNVAGTQAIVTSIIPAGADPHGYEPTPADIDEIADADLVLEHGLHYDEWAHNLVEQSGTDAIIAEVTNGVATIEGGDEDHREVDPHVWFDVANVKTMTTNIRDALIQADPDGRATYEANAEQYLKQLDELDAWIVSQVETIPEQDRKLVTSHEAFGYYVHAYGFDYVGTVVASLDSQAQASAQQVEELLKLIEAEGVRAIFTESTISPDLTKQIADEADIEVVTDLYSDSLSDDGSETDTYIGMMRHNTTAIVDALT